MSRVSAELLRRWDEDPDAGFGRDSSFTSWWSQLVKVSIENSVDETYAACVHALKAALSYTVRATQSDIGYLPLALSYTMRAMELWRGCDSRAVPSNPGAFDLEDLDQAILLVAFQFDAVVGTDEWVSCLDEYFGTVFRTVGKRIALGAEPVETIRQAIDDGEETDLDDLDHAKWAIGMLEWLKLEDPRRNIGINLGAVHESLLDLEDRLRPVLRNLRRAGAVSRDPLSPRSFWWRH